MAFVQHVNSDGPGDPFYETLGMITFEDVIADIFQSEIVSEPPDIIVDSSDEMKNLKQINRNNFSRLPRAKKELTDQLTTAVCQFLSSSVIQFSHLMMSETVLRRLLKHDVVLHHSLSDTNMCNLLYQRGKPADYFTLIVEGHVEIHIGTEGFVFDGGPFMYFGAQALTGAMVTSGLTSPKPPAEVGDGSSNHIYIPDYSVCAVTNLVVVRVTVQQYSAALHAVQLERHLRAAGENHSGDPCDSCLSQCGDSLVACGEFPLTDDAASPVQEAAIESQLLDNNADATLR